MLTDSLLLAAILALAVPGPINRVLFHNGGRHGVRAAIQCIPPIAAGFLMALLPSAFAWYALVSHVPELGALAAALGTAGSIALMVTCLRSAPEPLPIEGRNQMVLAGLTDPMAMVLAPILALLPAGDHVGASLALASTAATVGICWAMFGQRSVA